MKSIQNFSMIAFVAIFFIFIGCREEETVAVPEPGPMLKSATGGVTPNCEPSDFNLLIKQELKAGSIRVSNNNDNLVIEVIPETNLIFTDIQLWIGTNPRNVPSGKNRLPLTEKFKYKSAAPAELIYVIPLSEIYTRNPETACEAKKLFIFTHIVADIAETTETEKISAWSEGTVLGNSKSVSYSTYTTCCQSTGGGGCTPYLAWGGEKPFDNKLFYDTGIGGIQDILAENGVVAGWIKWEGGVLSFAFDQDWMFNDLIPPASLIVIEGYNELGGAPTPIEIEAPAFSQEIFSMEIPYFPYYHIDFNIQNCTTEK